MPNDPQYHLNRKAAADAESARRETADKAAMLDRANALVARNEDPAESFTAEELAWCGFSG